MNGINTDEKFEKGDVCICNGKKVVLMNSFIVNQESAGYMVLNFWEPGDCGDIDVLPVSYIECNDDREFYQLSKDNLIVGRVGELCSI